MHLAVGLFLQCDGRRRCGVAVAGGLEHRAEAAKVVLEIVDSPRRVGAGILRLMAVTAFKLCAGLWSRRRIDAELQPSCMNVVCKSLHVWKAIVALDGAVGTTLSLPTVVDIDVNVSGVAHAVRDHRVCSSAYVSVGDALKEMIPTVPAHRRRPGKSYLRRQQAVEEE